MTKSLSLQSQRHGQDTAAGLKGQSANGNNSAASCLCDWLLVIKRHLNVSLASEMNLQPESSRSGSGLNTGTWTRKMRQNRLGTLHFWQSIGKSCRWAAIFFPSELQSGRSLWASRCNVHQQHHNSPYNCDHARARVTSSYAQLSPLVVAFVWRVSLSLRSLVTHCCFCMLSSHSLPIDLATYL